MLHLYDKGPVAGLHLVRVQV